MPEALFPNLYRIKIPLPDSPLKYLNSYVFTANDRHLVVDTGLNRRECFEAMTAGLKALDVDLDRTDFFITHLHADHFGLVNRLVAPTGKIYFNRPDSELIESWEGFDPMIAYGGLNGFPEDDLRAALHNHPGYKHGSDWMPALSIINDGQVIHVGDYALRCVLTPGHTAGHMCLYEASQEFLIAGDHLLIDITPNIQCWSDDDNPLKSYLESLEKVRGLTVSRVLPGHRRLFSDHRRRIDELKHHHAKRAEEALGILEKGPMSAYDVAAKMQWDIRCDRWEDFPVAQRWFATGEAISHLRYLEEAGRAARETGPPLTRYRRIDDHSS
jgi:glyoxylase-like metal-dependent hydrolase (beta-lactamase superfamily II)